MYFRTWFNEQQKQQAFQSDDKDLCQFTMWYAGALHGFKIGGCTKEAVNRLIQTYNLNDPDIVDELMYMTKPANQLPPNKLYAYRTNKELGDFVEHETGVFTVQPNMHMYKQMGIKSKHMTLDLAIHFDIHTTSFDSLVHQFQVLHQLRTEGTFMTHHVANLQTLIRLDNILQSVRLLLKDGEPTLQLTSIKEHHVYLTNHKENQIFVTSMIDDSYTIRYVDRMLNQVVETKRFIHQSGMYALEKLHELDN